MSPASPLSLYLLPSLVLERSHSLSPLGCAYSRIVGTLWPRAGATACPCGFPTTFHSWHRETMCYKAYICFYSQLAISFFWLTVGTRNGQLWGKTRSPWLLFSLIWRQAQCFGSHCQLFIRISIHINLEWPLSLFFNNFIDESAVSVPIPHSALSSTCKQFQLSALLAIVAFVVVFWLRNLNMNRK